MDFHDSPDEAAFRKDARAWLRAHAPAFRVPPGADEHAAHALGRRWQGCKADGGYVGFTLPAERGGRGGGILDQMIFQEEEAACGVPRFNSFIEGTEVVVPVVAAHGTPEQFERIAAPTLRGDMVWCQLFSEPAAGSDVAALRTRATRDGDAWVVNGQKVWTSDAHLSDWGLLLARTDPDVPKYRGLTMFLVDLRTPGIDIRPITKINGDREFNEVFFTDVRIPDALRIGTPGAGWKVAHATFHAEHLAFSGAPSVIGDVFDPLWRIATRLRDTDGRALIENAAVRQVLADYHVARTAVRYTRYRQYTTVAKGGQLGFESAISKLVLARLLQRVGAFGMDLAGSAGLAFGGSSDDADLAALQEAFLVGPGLRIGGGTDEIALNNIAERVLGLPADIAPDKNRPFREDRIPA